MSAVDRRSWTRAALVVVVALGLTWWLLHSPLAAYSSATVVGYEGDDAARLQAAIDAAAHDGTLLTIPRQQVAAAAKRFPSVGDVVVTRTFPRGLRVRVIPARAVAAVVSTRGSNVLVDYHGRAIGPAPAKHHYARVRMNAAPPKVGSHVPTQAMALVEFVRELDPEIAARTRALHLTARGRIEGRLDDTTVIVGAPERHRARAVALRAIVNNLSDEDLAAAHYVDISVPDRPAVGFRPLRSASS